MSDNTHDLLKKQYEGPPTFEVWGEWGIKALLAELLGSDKLEPFNDGRPLHCQIMAQGFAKAMQQRLPFQDVMHQLTWLLGWYLHIRQDEDRADKDRGNTDEHWAMMDVMYEYPKLAAQDREGKSINEAFDSAGKQIPFPVKVEVGEGTVNSATGTGGTGTSTSGDTSKDPSSADPSLE